MPACSRPLRGCRFHPPYADTHHIWWPGKWYTIPTEKRFRNHRLHVKTLCRCLHDLEHCKKPPRKPSEAHMRAWLDKNSPK